MPTLVGQENIHLKFGNKQVQFLENKVNNLRWLNNKLNKDVFDAEQRGHRLAAKLGFQDLDEAERALATQPGQGASGEQESRQSQVEQLSQWPPDELASHVRALQSELVSHVHLSRSTLSALDDAVVEIMALREQNRRLRERNKVRRVLRRKVRERRRSASNSKALDHARSEVTSRALGDASSVLPSRDPDDVHSELSSLKEKYYNLLEVKRESDEKHAKDYLAWKKFKVFYERCEAFRKFKRRKLNPKGDGDDKKVTPAEEPPLSSSSSMTNVPTSRSPRLNESGPSPTSCVPTSPKPKPAKACSPEPIDATEEDYAASSETEPDSQPVTFLYPSQLDATESSSTAAQKRSQSPAPDFGSSDTEFESQSPEFLYDSQIVPLTPAQVSELTPRVHPVLRNTQQQLMTPVSIARPKEQGKASSSTAMPPPASSPLRADPFRRPAEPLGGQKARLPDTPASSRPSKKGKGKERADENDENVPASTSLAASPPEKKYPADYSIYKGRGRYGAAARTGEDTAINALFEINPKQNEGVGFQYDEVVRDKGRRKQMHAADCECCRDYYSAVGPLPNRLQPPKWRSPQSSPSKKRKRDSFEDDKDDGDADGADAAIAAHRNAISRHREHWARGETPPGYWNIGFPDTQEVEEMNAQAARMHARKRAMVADEAERGGKYKRR